MAADKGKKYVVFKFGEGFSGPQTKDQTEELLTEFAEDLDDGIEVWELSKKVTWTASRATINA